MLLRISRIYRPQSIDRSKLRDCQTLVKTPPIPPKGWIFFSVVLSLFYRCFPIFGCIFYIKSKKNANGGLDPKPPPQMEKSTLMFFFWKLPLHNLCKLYIVQLSIVIYQSLVVHQMLGHKPCDEYLSPTLSCQDWEQALGSWPPDGAWPPATSPPQAMLHHRLMSRYPHSYRPEHCLHWLY